MSLKAVFFGFNSVIINDESIHRELIETLLLAENLRPDATEYREICLGRSDRAALQEMLSRQGRVVSPEYLNRLVARKADAYERHLAERESLPVYPGIGNFANQLWAAGLLLGIVTGATRQNVTYVLERSGLAQPFEVIVTGDDIKASKPDPEGYLLAVDRLAQVYPNLSLQPRNCLAIEGTAIGIEAAKGAKMQVVGVANTYPFHMLQRQTNWTVDYLGELEIERVKQVFSQLATR